VASSKCLRHSSSQEMRQTKIFSTILSLHEAARGGLIGAKQADHRIPSWASGLSSAWALNSTGWLSENLAMERRVSKYVQIPLSSQMWIIWWESGYSCVF